jgi:subfamily B ATP-binding cassette protein MsbA
MKEYFRLIKLLKPYRRLLVLSFILVLLFSITNGISVYLSIPLLRTLFLSGDTSSQIIQVNQISGIIDSLRYRFESYIFAGGDKYSALVKVCVLMVIFYFLKNLFGYLQSILTQYVEKSLITSIRRKLYHKFNSLSLKYFSEKKAGDIISRFVNDINLLQNTVSVTFTNLLKDPI